ncbi:hypothetical protein D3C71_1968840 [compost metagenome]
MLRSIGTSVITIGVIHSLHAFKLRLVSDQVFTFESIIAFRKHVSDFAIGKRGLTKTLSKPRTPY